VKKIFVFLVLTSMLSCRKTVEKIVEVEKKYAWNELKDITGRERILLNSAVINDSVILFASGYVIQSYNANTLKRISGYVFGYAEAELAHKPFFSKRVLVRSLKNYIDFSPVTAPITSGARAAYNPAFANDTSFVEFQKQYIRFNPQFHTVKDRYVLAPFKSKKNNSQNSYAYLFRLNPAPASGEDNLKLENVKEVELSSAIGNVLESNYYSSSCYFDKFFISIGDNTYRIDTAGNVKAFGAPMYSLSDMFRLGTVLFGMNPNGRLYSSTDGGENWNLFYDFADTIYGFIAFEQVGDEVFAYLRDNIWQVTLNGSSLSFTELKNEGLERSSITSISKAGDKAFVTTLFGVYYRKWSEFKEKKNG
jgi:hypothetical protein